MGIEKSNTDVFRIVPTLEESGYHERIIILIRIRATVLKAQVYYYYCADTNCFRTSTSYYSYPHAVIFSKN